MIQYYKSRITFGFVFLLLMLSFSQFALGATYPVTSSQCTGAGSLVEAMGYANANPDTDTISLAAGLTIDAGGCPPWDLPTQGTM